MDRFYNKLKLNFSETEQSKCWVAIEALNWKENSMGITNLQRMLTNLVEEDSTYYDVDIDTLNRFHSFKRDELYDYYLMSESINIDLFKLDYICSDSVGLGHIEYNKRFNNLNIITEELKKDYFYCFGFIFIPYIESEDEEDDIIGYNFIQPHQLDIGDTYEHIRSLSTKNADDIGYILESQIQDADNNKALLQEILECYSKLSSEDKKLIHILGEGKTLILTGAREVVNKFLYNVAIQNILMNSISAVLGFRDDNYLSEDEEDESL